MNEAKWFDELCRTVARCGISVVEARRRSDVEVHFSCRGVRSEDQPVEFEIHGYLGINGTWTVSGTPNGRPLTQIPQRLLPAALVTAAFAWMNEELLGLAAAADGGRR